MGGGRQSMARRMPRHRCKHGIVCDAQGEQHSCYCCLDVMMKAQVLQQKPTRQARAPCRRHAAAGAMMRTAAPLPNRSCPALLAHQRLIERIAEG